MYRKTFDVSWPIALAFVIVWFNSDQYTIESVYVARANDMTSITLSSEVGAFEDVLDEFNQIVASFRSIE